MPQIKLNPPSIGNDGNNGGGHWGNGSGHGDPFERSVSMPKMLMYLFIGSLTVMFAALALIYVLRSGEKLNYPFTAPESLWFSTLFIVVSSLTYHWGLQKLKDGALRSFRAGVLLTLVLGLCFLVAQCFAWSQVYATISNSSPAPIRNLFYVLTGVHAVHLFGGLVWLGAVVRLGKLGKYTPKERLGPELAGIYWHFLDFSWLVFFALLILR